MIAIFRGDEPLSCTDRLKNHGLSVVIAVCTHAQVDLTRKGVALNASENKRSGDQDKVYATKA
jgi:hypothetical protein